VVRDVDACGGEKDRLAVRRESRGGQRARSVGLCIRVVKVWCRDLHVKQVFTD